MSAYLSPLFRAYGVFEADGADAGVAAHYGNPLVEQRHLAYGGQKFVAVDFSQLDVVSVAGEDRLSWLTTLSSQVLTGLGQGQSIEFLLLSPQGRVEYAPLAVEHDEKVYLLVEHGQGEPLAEYLNRMKFMLRVEITHESENLAALGSVADPRTSALAPQELAQGIVVEDPWHSLAVGGTSYTSLEAQQHPGVDYRWFYTLVARDALEKLGEELELAGAWAAAALRIEAWRPRYGTEVDAKSIPHELDYLRSAVHLSKGCYKGQETVARVHNLGHPPRRLTFLDLDGSEHTLPRVGAQIMANGKKAGVLTSVAQHHEAGPIALAVLKRTVPLDAELRIIDTVESDAENEPATVVEYAAAQTEIVSPEAGQVAGRRIMGDFFKG